MSLLKDKYGRLYYSLEYIENTSNAYIDTGFVINPQDTNTKVNINISFTRDMGRQLFGFYHYNYWNGLEPGLGFYWYTFKGELNKKYSFEFDITKKPNGKYKLINSIDDHTKVIDDIVYTSDSFKTNLPGPGNDQTFYGTNYGRIYSIVCKCDNIITRNFYPAQDMETNEIGMLDGVSGEFFVSPNGSKFVGSKRSQLGLNGGWGIPDYFYLENAYEGENQLIIQNATGRNLEYTTDPWKPWHPYDFNVQPKMTKKGDRVYLRGTNKTFNNKSINCSQDFAIGGDLTTLLNRTGKLLDLTGRDEAFRALFADANLINIDKLKLPSLKLSYACYSRLFASLDKSKGMRIVNCPENLLPATQLAPYCYESLFRGNWDLITTPLLPAMKMEPHCYESAFLLCKSLVVAPKLPAMELAEWCYNWMFNYDDLLEIPPELPAIKLAPWCYANMFINCFKLKYAPKLPAMELAQGCYEYMFKWCYDLKEAPELPATKLAEACYAAMFFGDKFEVAPELPATELAPYCYTGIFCYCQNLKVAPKLPATKLAPYCYGGYKGHPIYGYDAEHGMFQGCYNINKIEVNATEWNPEWTKNWLASTSSTGTFIKPTSLVIPEGVHGKPKGWQIVNK